MSFDTVWQDRRQRQSLIFELIVASETLTKLSPEARALSGRIPWRMITDTRNRLVHAYWRQDRAFFEELVKSAVPDLVEAIGELVLRLDGSP